MKNRPYTILVNSSDNFEDCWKPFFTLFKKNWGACNAPILLNTENKDFSFDGLEIAISKSHEFVTNRKLTWSECLINALIKIQTPLVLYLQEDYFIESHVQYDIINDFADLMLSDYSIKHIGLTHFGSNPPYSLFKKDNRLMEISKNSKYRISTQAALWDKETLLSYLKPEENGWMFEIFGTKRASKRNDLFLTANQDYFNFQSGLIIEYIHTGIIKGKWNKGIPRLFEENNINIDFSKRGFYEPKSWLIRKIETFKKLLKNPSKFITGISGH